MGPFGLIHRYMFMETLRGVATALLIVGTVIILIDFVEQSRDIGTRVDVSGLQLFIFTLLKFPSLIETTLPFIMLFGVLSALFRLNRRSELIVMRASGMSAWRILSAPMILSIAFGLIGAMVVNPLGATTNAVFERERDALMNIRRDPNAEEQVWLRETSPEGFTIISARAIEENDGELRSPSILYFSTNTDGIPQLIRRIDADRASLEEGYWQVENAIERAPNATAIELGAVSLPTRTARQALFERARSPDGVSFWALPPLIESAREAGLATERYELRFQGLLALPLTLFAATVIGAAATMRLHRLGGAAGFALAGGIAGFITFFLMEVLSSFAAAGALTPFTAAWAAPALMALLALIYIASTEDG